MTTIDDAFVAQLQDLMKHPYHRVIAGEPVEGYLAEVPELPGCITAGRTPEEALSNLEAAMAVWLESALVHDDPIPEPVNRPCPSQCLTTAPVDRPCHRGRIN